MYTLINLKPQHCRGVWLAVGTPLAVVLAERCNPFVLLLTTGALPCLLMVAESAYKSPVEPAFKSERSLNQHALNGNAVTNEHSVPKQEGLQHCVADRQSALDGAEHKLAGRQAAPYAPTHNQVLPQAGQNALATARRVLSIWRLVCYVLILGCIGERPAGPFGRCAVLNRAVQAPQHILLSRHPSAALRSSAAGCLSSVRQSPKSSPKSQDPGAALQAWLLRWRWSRGTVSCCCATLHVLTMQRPMQSRILARSLLSLGRRRCSPTASRHRRSLCCLRSCPLRS